MLEVAAAQQALELGGDEARQARAVVADALEEGRQVLGDDAPQVARRSLPRDVPDGSARGHARRRCNERGAGPGRVIAAAWVDEVARVASGRDTDGPWTVMSSADSRDHGETEPDRTKPRWAHIEWLLAQRGPDGGHAALAAVRAGARYRDFVDAFARTDPLERPLVRGDEALLERRAERRHARLATVR